MENISSKVVLSVRDLNVETVSASDPRAILQSVSFDVHESETLCIVGESGSGKSVTVFSIMGLLPPDSLRLTSGTILLNGRDLASVPYTDILALRATTMSMVFQEPMTALNPIQRIGDQLDEVIRIHRRIPAAQRREIIIRMLTEVDFPDPVGMCRRYPHELSGGQRQRVVIAMALILEPKVLIADEPTTALDVTTQKQILYLMKRLQKVHGTSVIFITHDFGVVAEIADRILVMHHGVAVERGDRRQILSNPVQAYTRELVSSVPGIRPPARKAPKTEVALSIEGVSMSYGRKPVFGFGKGRMVSALKDISLDIKRDEIVGVVGESGSGKSTLARCVVGLIHGWTGSIRLGDRSLEDASRKRPRDIRRRIQIVFQDPNRSLNPRRRVAASLMEGLVNFGMPVREARAKIAKVLGVVGLEEDVLDRYPHQFSGGQRQRLCLARAIVMEPEILIADEATSALDVTVQSQVLELLAEIKQRTRIAILFITHDLRVATKISDRIVVLQNGRIIEQGAPQDIIPRPCEDYTRELIQSAPGRDWDFKNFRPFDADADDLANTRCIP
ncbi:ABC transporter ATP-binding protein [Castellaniella sp. GW247-6E4]|uniref:ABC transporter ATP-binding protein n=1 Tax=Castellaniella sp. GW247-6E4 TaxID=3140380 RepID=UPI0033155976